MTHKQVGLFAVAFAVLWWILLVGRPLLDPDEGRYAEIPREMLTNGNWVIPHLNGLAYLEKPPLQYWATEIAYSVFGVQEWSARLWTGLTSFLTVMLVYGFAARTWGQREGLWAAGILASSTLFVLIGHQLTLDASLTFFLTLALLAFCEAQRCRDRPRRARLCMWVCWAAMGAAVLTKGIVGILIPGAVLVIYSLWQRDWACWKHLCAGVGLPLFLLIVMPWLVLAARANPDFLQFFFVHEHFERFLTKVHGRYQPWWFFLAILVVGAQPWLPQTVRALLTGAQRTQPVGSFDVQRVLWMWSVFVLVFFSVSDSKLIPYILPMFPTLALMMARHGMECAKDTKIALVTTCIAVSGLLTCTQLSSVLGHNPTRIAAWIEFQPTLYWAAAALFAGAAFGIWSLQQNHAPRAAMSLGAAWLLGIGLLLKSMGPINPLYSAKSLAFAAPEGYDSTVPVYSVDMYHHSLSFYWQRALTLVDYRGELALGLDQEPRAGITTVKEFEQRWTELPDALAVMPAALYQTLAQEHLPMRVVARTADAVIVDRR